ncbi:MAG: thiamine pyrophosphate-binding protein [Myxococcales bacterium]|nr:thiamine pyrophosphate-binding protein [Myxococcales bacterium]
MPTNTSQLSNLSAKLGRTPTINGGEIITRLLAQEGVAQVFGIIDGTYFGFYEAFERNGIALTTPRHETCAVHMAGAYARLTGKLGVCMASNGPGVANALPGVAVEHAEGNRVLLVTSSRRTGISYPERGGTFQYFPQTQVIGQMSKLSIAVPSVNRLAELTRRALRACFSGRPGLVHLDVPESVMNGSVQVDERWFRSPGMSRATTPMAVPPSQILTAVQMLKEAKRPLIHAGSGVLHAGAFAELVALSETLHAPITTSWAARAVVDERHPNALPMCLVGPLTQARNEADLVIVLGSRLGETDFWGKAPYWAKPEDQQLIQVDIDDAVLGNNRPADLAVQADVKLFMKAMTAALKGPTPRKTSRLKWMDKLEKAKAKRRAQLDKHLKKDTLPLHSSRVAGTCQDELGDDAVLVIDGGNTAVWANFFWQVRKPNTILTTPKMGMLGAGVSQAVAAKIARPDAPVVCVIGDGAMAFHQQEVETAVRNETNVIWVVLCDKQWGMVKMNQQFMLKPLKTLVNKSLSPEETINADLHEIEFDQLGRAMGAHGERVADAAGLRSAIVRSVLARKPAVIHVDVDPVAHMWAPELRTFQAMHAEPAG